MLIPNTRSASHSGRDQEREERSLDAKENIFLKTPPACFAILMKTVTISVKKCRVVENFVLWWTKVLNNLFDFWSGWWVNHNHNHNPSLNHTFYFFCNTLQKVSLLWEKLQHILRITSCCITIQIYLCISADALTCNYLVCTAHFTCYHSDGAFCDVGHT